MKLLFSVSGTYTDTSETEQFSETFTGKFAANDQLIIEYTVEDAGGGASATQEIRIAATSNFDLELFPGQGKLTAGRVMYWQRVGTNTSGTLAKIGVNSDDAVQLKHATVASMTADWLTNFTLSFRANVDASGSGNYRFFVYRLVGA